jgi:hypothetical protein
MWRFMELANSVFERCDDSSGTVIGIFHAACSDLGEIASAVKPDAKALAERVFNALNDNDYGQYDDLIEVLAPVLGQQGLEHLKARFIELSKAPVEKPREQDRKVIGWGSGGPFYADESAARQRDSTIGWRCSPSPICRATSMRSSPSRAQGRERCRGWRPRSHSVSWRPGEPRKPGLRSTQSMKIALAGSHSSGRRRALR